MPLKVITLSILITLTLITSTGSESTDNNITGNVLSSTNVFLVCEFQGMSAECEVSGTVDDANELKVAGVIPKAGIFGNQTTKFFTFAKNFGSSSIPQKIGEKFPKLESFRVTKTSIKAVGNGDFECLKDLRHLSLDSNKISIIYQDALYDLPELDSLYISNNKIEFLHPDLFKNSLKLRSFIADYNFIQMLDGRLFKNNEKLEWISLSKNRLKDIKVDFRDLKNSLHVNFEKNFGECDVKLDENSTNFEEKEQKIAEFQMKIEQNCRIFET